MHWPGVAGETSEQPRSQARHTENGEIVYFPGPANSDSESRDVERLNHHAFYTLGQQLERIGKYSGETAAGVPILDLWGAQRVVGELLSGTPIPVTVCRAAAQELYSALTTVINQHYYFTDNDGKIQFQYPGPDAAPIYGWEWGNINRLRERFETIFSAEMTELTTYWIPRRGIYFTPALVDAADQSFPVDILGMVPDKTRDDWKSAGRCLAFNLLTASGFHVARAVEGILEAYYQKFANRPGNTLRSWNDYIKALEELPRASDDAAPTKKTLAELRQMKDDYRNPIAHPRVVLSEADARMLFDNGESLIIAIAQELKLAATGAQPALALIQSDATAMA